MISKHLNRVSNNFRAFRLVTLNSSTRACFSTQFSRLSSSTTKTTSNEENTPQQQTSGSEQAVKPENTSSPEQENNTTIPEQTSTNTDSTPFNLQSTASLIMDSAESLKQKRELLQKELESRKDAEVMLKKIIYRGIRAFGVLFVAVCLLIWAVKRKNLEAKVKKFNEKIKKSGEKEQDLERELEANFSYIKKDIENKSATNSTNN